MGKNYEEDKMVEQMMLADLHKDPQSPYSTWKQTEVASTISRNEGC